MSRSRESGFKITTRAFWLRIYRANNKQTNQLSRYYRPDSAQHKRFDQNLARDLL